MKIPEYLEYGRREEFNLLEIFYLWSEETGDDMAAVFKSLIDLLETNSKNQDTYGRIWAEAGGTPSRSDTTEENESALIAYFRVLLKEGITVENVKKYHLVHELYLRRKPLIELMRQAGINVPAFLRPDDSISPSNRPPAYDYCFFKRETNWEVGQSDDAKSLGDLKGMPYIHKIIQHPGREYTPGELSRLIEKPPLNDPAAESAIEGLSEQGINIAPNLDSKSDIGIALDAKGREACLKGLAEIDAKIAATDDPVEKLALKEQKQKIEKLLIKDSDRESKYKTKARSHTNRERERVEKNMRRALERLIKHCPAVSAVLNNDTIKIGAKIVYHPNPDNTPSWKTKTD